MYDIPFEALYKRYSVPHATLSSLEAKRQLATVLLNKHSKSNSDTSVYAPYLLADLQRKLEHDLEGIIYTAAKELDPDLFRNKGKRSTDEMNIHLVGGISLIRRTKPWLSVKKAAMQSCLVTGLIADKKSKTVAVQFNQKQPLMASLKARQASLAAERFSAMQPYMEKLQEWHSSEVLNKFGELVERYDHDLAARHIWEDFCQIVAWHEVSKRCGDEQQIRLSSEKVGEFFARDHQFVRELALLISPVIDVWIHSHSCIERLSEPEYRRRLFGYSISEESAIDEVLDALRTSGHLPPLKIKKRSKNIIRRKKRLD